MPRPILHFRPTYPKYLFDFIYSYHAQSGCAEWEKVVDLGCGTGQATLEVAKQFEQAVGCDMSPRMVENARLSAEQSNVVRKPTFEVSAVEKLGFLTDRSVDMAIAAQAVHWFDYKTLFPELARVLKPGGTVAFWNYPELRFRGRQSLDPLLSQFMRGEKSLGPYWEEPGRSILESYLQRVPIPTETPWDTTSTRRVYFVEDREPKLEGEKYPVILKKYLSWDSFEQYLRTWSSLYNYLASHPDDRDQEGRDIVDRFVKEVRERGETVGSTDAEDWKKGFVAEWTLVLVLLRKRPE